MQGRHTGLTVLSVVSKSGYPWKTDTGANTIRTTELIDPTANCTIFCNEKHAQNESRERKWHMITTLLIRLSNKDLTMAEPSSGTHAQQVLLCSLELALFVCVYRLMVAIGDI
jgi:hypothetical protein